VRTFSNLAISLDGKIADLRDPKARLGTPFDRKMMNVIRAQADAIIIGASTLRVYPFAMTLGPSKKSKSMKQPANVIITNSGNIPASGAFWKNSECIRFVFTSRKSLRKVFEIVQDRAFVIAAGEDEVDLKVVLKRLAESGMKNILIEGGGEVMASFLQAKLLQELYVTLTPWLLGGRDNPSLVGGNGLKTWSKLKVKSVKKVGQEFYYHYRVEGAKRL